MLSWLRRRLGGPDYPRLEVAQPTALGRATAHFTAALTTQLELPANAVFGPTSTFDLLAQLRQFASGSTSAELSRVLGTDADVGRRRTRYRDDPDVTIHTATAVFAPPSVMLAADLAQPPLHVERLPTSGAAERINSWVDETTHGRLPQLVTQEDCASLRQLMLVDALYFEGRWRDPFAPERTGPGVFHTAGERAEVTMMTLEAPLYVAPDDGPLLVSLPYRGNRFALDVVVGLDPHDIDGWQARRRRARRRPVRLSLPRFSIDPPRLELRPALEAMGLRAVFDAERAELPGLGPKPIWLQRLVHRARIDVDEAGTVAAAATVGFGQQSRDPDALVVKVDRPFTFFLHDTVDPSVLFLGRVSDPRQS